MAYKPEQIDRRYPYCDGAKRRMVRDAKKAAKRKRRRAERPVLVDPKDDRDERVSMAADHLLENILW